MSADQKLTIVNVGYRSTNFWVVSAGRTRLMVDLGWPGMMGAMVANLKRMDIPLEEIRYGLATHYHIDHAGCAEELKQRGMRLIVTPEQVDAIPAMKQWMKPGDGYVDIRPDGNLVLPVADSRALLAKIGIGGEIVRTPGHTDDSVTLVLDSGAAFTGDLTPEGMAEDRDVEAVARSWQTLRDRGVTMIYGGHGPARPLRPKG